MRVFAVAMVALGVAVGSVSTGWAWFGIGDKKKETPVSQSAPAVQQGQQPSGAANVEEPKAPVIDEKAQKAREEAFKSKMVLVGQKKQQLNNTEWQVDLIPLSGKGKKETDTLVFRDNKVALAGYQKKGFPVTNYSINFQNDGTLTIWETMQTSEKSGVVFLRGELDEKMTIMRGVLSHKLDDATTEDFSFVSTSKKAASAAPAPVKK